jgi:hypothetical protein
MYCSSCGAESNQGLRYCTRCGADSNPPQQAASPKPRGLVWIVAFGIAMMMGLPAGGIAMVFERIPELLDKGLPLWFLTVLAVISLLMMSVATVLLGHLLSPVFKSYLASGEAANTTTEKRTGDRQAQIQEPPVAISSVTEETTRSFERVPGEHNTH